MQTVFIAPEECGQLSEMHNGDGFDIRYDQEEAGAFTGECLYRGNLNMVFCREQYSRGICIHGTVPYGMVTAVMSTKRKGSAWLNGEEIAPDCLGVLTPGDSGAFRTPADHGFTNFIISHDRLERAVRALYQLPLSEVLQHTATLHLPPTAMALLRESTTEVFTPKSPDAILRREVWDRKCEGGVLQALCVALAADHHQPEDRLAVRNHWRIARHVRNYIEANIGDDLDLETLCTEAKTSARTLENAFQEVYGIGPMLFIRRRRLNAVRHALKAANPAESSVKSIALEMGFAHLGRFSEAYQALFGESPSATLKVKRRIAVGA
jgi:AraC family ethanolamine operon transcriptional activator